MLECGYREKYSWGKRRPLHPKSLTPEATAKIHAFQSLNLMSPAPIQEVYNPEAHRSQPSEVNKSEDQDNPPKSTKVKTKRSPLINRSPTQGQRETTPSEDQVERTQKSTLRSPPKSRLKQPPKVALTSLDAVFHLSRECRASVQGPVRSTGREKQSRKETSPSSRHLSSRDS